MFYPKTQVYINDGVFFDLKNMRIFMVDANTESDFEKLYNRENIEISKRSSNYDYLVEHYFSDSKSKVTEKTCLPDFTSINNIQLKISNKCNMACDYCYANKGNYGKNDCLMSKEVTNATIAFINSNIKNIQKISFFGGEPFLNIPSMQNFLENIENKEILYSTVTNGTLLNERVIKLIKEHNLKFVVSIDGPEDIHNFHRRFNNKKGTYRTIRENLKKLKENSIHPTMIEAVYTRNSEMQSKREEIAEWLYKEFEPRFIAVNDVVTDAEEYIPQKEDLGDLEEFVKSVFKTIRDEKYFLISYVYTIITRIMDRARSANFCGAGISSIFVNENGDIYPCQLFDENEDYYMGNVFDLDINKYREINNKLNLLNRNKLNKCKQCICSFWCTSCIGNKKEVEKVECAHQHQDCYNKQHITQLTLNYFSALINSGELENFKENIERIIDET